MTLNIFNKHADRVKMANIAQAVNVLQAVVLTDGAQMVLTPTFYAFELYKAHQGARLLKSELIAGEKDGLPVAQNRPPCRRTVPSRRPSAILRRAMRCPCAR